MRFVFIIVMCAPLILSDSSEDHLSVNEIPIDSEKNIGKSLENHNDRSEKDFLTLEQIYKNSVDSYLDEDWQGCVDGFTEAVRRYKEYRRVIIKCRMKCREVAEGTEPTYPENVEDLHFYEKKLRETLCLLNCYQDYRDENSQNSLKQLSLEIQKKFTELAAYEYLQICNYQVNNFQDAANAVYTYLVAHPKHEMSIQNLKYYISLPDVEEAKIINLEAEPFVKYYITGVTVYNEENYKEAIYNLEQSLLLYFQSEENCRFYCEGPFNQGWYPEFTASIANHFTHDLKCKIRCYLHLNNINGEFHEDLLPSHYNYLQYAYYKTGDIERACAAVSNYLLFYPSDETMEKNQKYYSKLPKVTKEFFTPTKQVLAYVKRRHYEKRLLSSIGKEFIVLGERLHVAEERHEEDNRKKSEHQFINDPPSTDAASLRSSNEDTKKHKETKIEEDEKFSSEEDLKDNTKIRIVADENDLGGELRYLAEGFLNGTECQSLIHLAEIGAVENDGYDGEVAPHSIYESFKGLTLGRAALMVYFGLMKLEVLELALSTTEIARDHVQKYFNLDRPLYFSYTHLACRTALPDSTVDRQDMSHEIHADNCIIAENGICHSVWPAYTFRDYSAIIYLNDNFDGGEFIFAEDPKARTIQSTVNPSCGRMVAFSASGKNLHGVRGVLRGRRCALGLWFTQDINNSETERTRVRAIVQRVRDFGTVPPEARESVGSGNYEKLLSRCFEKDWKLQKILNSLQLLSR